MQIVRRLVWAVLIVAPAAAYATKPAVPSVTVGAAGMKQFQFDVTPVAGATSYELWFLPNGGATWVKYMTTIDADPLFKVSVSAHLLDWHNARYRVSACNADGCSTTANIAVTSLMKDTVGYFKPRAAKVTPYMFGESPTLSADGKTLAAISGETIGPNKRSANVYVYEKANSGWRRTARLLPSPVLDGTLYYGDVNFETIPRDLSISADGTAIAFGVPREYVPGSNLGRQGAVYLFRKSGTTWSLEQKIGPSAVREDQMGRIVDIDAHGQTLAIWRSDGNVGDENGYRYLEIWRRSASGWAFDKQFNRSLGIRNFDLSGDGKILAVYNYDRSIDVYSGANFATKQVLARMDVRSTRLGTIATNYDGSVIAFDTMQVTPPDGASWQPYVTAFRRSSSGWVAEPAFTYIARQTTPQLGVSEEFGYAIAVSDDGRFIAVGDPRNRYAGTGVLYPPVQTTWDETGGAIFVFERKPASWQLRNLIKPNVVPYPHSRFAAALAFGDNNRTLAVGAVLDASGAREIDGDPANTSGPTSGALWLY